jgi:hypothetical protein
MGAARRQRTLFVRSLNRVQRLDQIHSGRMSRFRVRVLSPGSKDIVKYLFGQIVILRRSCRVAYQRESLLLGVNNFRGDVAGQDATRVS